MQKLNDSVNAFVDTFTVTGKPQGSLSGLTVGVKDLFDVAGKMTGCGNPDWLKSHGAPFRHAHAVELLLQNGATLLGKTHTDELAYSLLGTNSHYGTPINSAAPDRLPGGSSSGSAAAVAAKLVDIGLGSDTGGSVRVPASFCGLYGLRTSHGFISLEGVMPLAPSFDTVGWMTSDLALLTEVAMACGLKESETAERKILLPDDLWQCADSAVVDALWPAVIKIQDVFGDAINLSLGKGQLEQWRQTFQICQAAEIWHCHGEWINKNAPSFGPGVRERFENASQIKPRQWEQATSAREDIRSAMKSTLSDGVLVVPTSPTIAPRTDASSDELDSFRNRALQILCPAGLAGCPQLTLPAGQVQGISVGLSLVGPVGSDIELLAMAALLTN